MIEQHLQAIEQYQTGISEELQAIREYLNQDYNLSAVREGDRIKIQWEGDINEIQWILNGKVVSLNYMWNETPFEPDPITGNSYYIGNEDTVDGITEVAVGIATWDDEKKESVFENKQTVPVSQPVTEPAKKPEYIGLWDFFNAPDEVRKVFNMGLSLSPNKEDTDPVLQQYGKVIPTIAGFDIDFSQPNVENILRQKVRNRISQLEEIGWENILWVNLQDEPKFDVKWQEIIVEEALNCYPVDVSFTYTADSINNGNYPRNLKRVAFNGYPFFQEAEGYEQIWTKEKFFEYYEDKVYSIWERIPGARLSFTAQCFSNDEKVKWRKPPLWSVQAYLEVAEMYNATLLLWQYKSRKDWKCLDAHDDLLQEWVQSLS